MDMVKFINEKENERMKLLIRYWVWVIAYEDCIDEGIEVSVESIDEFLNWIIENEDKLREYDIFNM